MLKNKERQTKVLAKRFHLNGHTIGFRPQTQKLELHYMSLLLTLGVKGLKRKAFCSECSGFVSEYFPNDKQTLSQNCVIHQVRSLLVKFSVFFSKDVLRLTPCTCQLSGCQATK